MFYRIFSFLLYNNYVINYNIEVKKKEWKLGFSFYEFVMEFG